MKKILIALVLGSLLVLALGTTAMADNGPHGGFTATTDACASCHRAHSASYGSNSLLIANPEALCLSCHDGTGAGTNVEDGVYMQSGSDAHAGGTGPTEGLDLGSLFAGGFDNALMATAWSGKFTYDTTFDATSRATTSKHDMDVANAIWGSGVANSANVNMTMECTSCHDPHGKAGWTLNAGAADDVKVASYRLLRFRPQGSDGFTSPGAVNWSGGNFPTTDAGTAAGTDDITGWTVPDNFATTGTEWYTIGTANRFAVGDYNVSATANGTGNAGGAYNLKNATASEAFTYVPAAVNTAFFCAQCHDRYFANSRLRNATDESVACGTIDPARPALNGVTLPVIAPVAGLHPTYPNECVAGTITISSVVYATWLDNRPSGDNTYKFMHSSGDIRLSADGTVTAGTGTTLSRSCVACHVAHGTAAQMTTALATNGSLATGSVLLRMDNRSICLRCHSGPANFTIAP